MGGENGNGRGQRLELTDVSLQAKLFLAKAWRVGRGVGWGRLWPTTLHALGFTLPINSYRWQPFPSQRLLPPLPPTLRLSL